MQEVASDHRVAGEMLSQQLLSLVVDQMVRSRPPGVCVSLKRRLVSAHAGLPGQMGCVPASS
jgi:hypothetical protein